MSNIKLFMEGHELAVLNRYYIWLTTMIDFEAHENYSQLLEYLHNTNFIWTMLGDDNRAEDGKALRARFMDETDYLNYDILLNKPCSVLEMLVAFAERIDKDVMDDQYGTAYWFWLMIGNLELDRCNNEDFSIEFVEKVLKSWLNRENCSDESGNKKGIVYQLFGKNYHISDELWFQMQAFVMEKYGY